MPKSISQIIDEFNLAINQSIAPEYTAGLTMGRELCNHSDTWRKPENDSVITNNALARLVLIGILETHIVIKTTITNLPGQSFVEYDVKATGRKFQGLADTAQEISVYLKDNYEAELCSMTPKLFDNINDLLEYRLTLNGMNCKAALLSMINEGETIESERIQQFLGALYFAHDSFTDSDIEESCNILGYRLVVDGETKIGVGTLETVCGTHPQIPPSQENPIVDPDAPQEPQTRRRSQKKKQLPPLEEVIETLPSPPTNEKENEHWVLAKTAADRTGLQLNSLNAMRNSFNAEKYGPFGRDSTGRVFWKPEESSKKVFYYVEYLSITQSPYR